MPGEVHPSASDGPAGSLTIAGAGIRAGMQTTHEARLAIRRADKVLFGFADEAPTRWLLELNASAESLAPLYREGRPYRDIYEDIVTTILGWVRRDLDVCAVSYGHPGVLDRSSREAVRRANAEGYRTRFLPGVSALDCLFVDLELDPGITGCQMFDATDFLVHARAPDITVPLVLLQISLIGGTHATAHVNYPGLALLAQKIAEFYGSEHEVVIYEATPYPVGSPTIERRSVRLLADGDISGMSSLFVPPASAPARDVDMATQLNVPS